MAPRRLWASLPFRPPQAMAAEPEADGLRGAPVTTLTRPRRRRWRAWRRPHAGPA